MKLSEAIENFIDLKRECENIDDLPYVSAKENQNYRMIMRKAYKESREVLDSFEIKGDK